jgi:hypothetical protein
MEKIMNKTIIGLVAIVIAVIIGVNIAGYANRETFTTRVTDKERIVTGSGEHLDSYYLIYTERGTYKLEDDLLYGNFRSSDWYGSIKVDSTYEFTTIGFRIGFASEYPNIVEFK